MTDQDQIPLGGLTYARKMLHSARNVFILAGAGMSADLGTPVYWTGNDARYGGDVAEDGYTHLDHATEGFQLKYPDKSAKYFRQKWKEMLAVPVASDNSPYTMLINWINEQKKDYFVITTNVDSAFIRSGFDESKILEYHGAYRNSQCKRREHGIFATTDPDIDVAHCPTCDRVSRPNVMFFDDLHYNSALGKIQYKRYMNALNFADDAVVLEIGAGTTVPRLRSETKILHRLKFPVIRINAFQGQEPNLHEQTASNNFVTLPMKTTEALQHLLNAE